MFIFAVTLGLLLTPIGNCPKTIVGAQTPQNQASSYFPRGQNTNSDSQPSDTWNSDPNRTQNGTDFIRKDSYTSEVLTAGRSDGYQASYTTYESKGFYAQSGFKPDSGIRNLTDYAPTVAAEPAIGAMPVPFGTHGNEYLTKNYSNSFNRPWTSRPTFGQSNTQKPLGMYGKGYLTGNWKRRPAFGVIGGKPVTFTRFPNPAVPVDSLAVAELGISSITGLGEEADEETERQPWQVSVFSKEVTPYNRVCGGSLVTSTAVISAARCFWGVGALPAKQFAVGAGPAAEHPSRAAEFFRRGDEFSSYLQQRDVNAIEIPPGFRGAASNYQEDIAVLLMERPFYLNEHLRPVCVSFDRALDERQLAAKNLGTILGFTPTMPRSHRVPVIAVEDCMRLTPEENRKYITSDKICAGVKHKPPTALVCFQDDGSGLAFLGDTAQGAIPYLRAVASTPLQSSFGCSAWGAIAYTHVRAHRAFLLQHVPGLEAECAERYHVEDQSEMEDGEDEEDEEDGEASAQFVCNCYC